MTSGATVFDNIITRLGGTIFTAHSRLTNPYDLSENNGNFLKKGYGLGLGPIGENTTRFVCDTRSLHVTFQISITRRYYALEHDITKKDTCDKDLLTDFESLLDDVHKNNLGNPGGLVQMPDFAGVQSVFVDKDLYRALIARLTVEYFRQA